MAKEEACCRSILPQKSWRDDRIWNIVRGQKCALTEKLRTLSLGVCQLKTEHPVTVVSARCFSTRAAVFRVLNVILTKILVAEGAFVVFEKM
jgi:hypothetical protein